MKELWNDGENTERLSNDSYNQLLMEQYKLYVEMYDRHSARRLLANTFFLTIHAIFISALGISLHNANNFSQTGLLAFPLIGLLVLCYTWWRMVRYYRHITTAKEAVIHAMEKRLPASPAGEAEQQAMAIDRPYNSLKRMELTLPFVFAALYILTYLYVLYIAYLG